MSRSGSWREQRNLTIEQLAKRTNINPFRVMDIELGMEAPEEAELNRLASVLGVRAADLLVPLDDSDVATRLTADQAHAPYPSTDSTILPGQ